VATQGTLDRRPGHREAETGPPIEGGLAQCVAVLAKVAESSYTLCMPSGVEHVSRSLSRRESQVMAWLEENVRR